MKNEGNTELSWLGDSAVNAYWTRIRETPEELAKRTNVFVDEASGALGVGDWRLPFGPDWVGSLANQAGLVASNVSTGSGVADPTDGYSYTLSAGNELFNAQLIVAAGGHVLNPRLPAASARLLFREHRSGGVSGAHADAVVTAFVDAWDPLTVQHTSRAVKRLARRSGWAIPPANRLWLHRSVIETYALPEGVAARELGAGTLFIVPDSAPPEFVVAVMAEFRALNDLDELPPGT